MATIGHHREEKPRTQNVNPADMSRLFIAPVCTPVKMVQLRFMMMKMLHCDEHDILEVQQGIENDDPFHMLDEITEKMNHLQFKIQLRKV
jgi:hypothetical protein